MNTRSTRGFALIATLIFTVLVAGLVATTLVVAVTSSRTAVMSQQEAQAFYMAEGGAEHAMAQLAISLQDGSLDDGELDEITPPVMEGWSWPEYGASKIGTPRQVTLSDGSHAGLYALVQTVEIKSRAQNSLGDEAQVSLTADAAAIPIFQFGVFYEKDVELQNGPPMTFGGWVHSNGNIYISADSALYEDPLTTPNKIFHDQKHSHDWENGIWIKKDDGTYELLDTFDSRFFPDPDAFKTESCSRFDCRVKTDAFGVDSLKVPLPDGMAPHEVIRPRDIDDTDQEKRAKFSWLADWYVEIDLDDIWADGSNICSVIEVGSTREAGRITPALGDCSGEIFKWTWEAFYDGREVMFVDVLDIDVAKLGTWIGSYSTGTTSVLYVTFTGTGTVDPTGDGIFPVVRMKEGQEITWGPFTVATDWSLYVQGDYNKDEWKPAALVGDAINILSNAWQDSNQQVLVENAASETWINAAILAGHSPTPCDHEDAGCVSPPYGGGFENFQRFREDWSPGASQVTYHYQGSLVSLHFSQKAVGTHGGHYYDPPLRDWAFDMRFDDPANLPPGTPNVSSILQVSFRPGLD